jgi:CRP-like cAMP-binding protein
MPDLSAHPLVRKLNSLVALSELEISALLGVLGPIHARGSHENLVRTNEKVDGVAVIISGFACQQRLLPDGRRQIVGYFLPGDICDTTSFVGQSNRYSVVALADSTIVMLSHSDLNEITSTYSHLARALWCHTVIETAIGREWLINVGQRTALERLAHLFCEVRFRMEAVGETTQAGCNLPVTQSELADTAALSTVHVNRTLKELRRLGLASLDCKTLLIHDFSGLRALAMFDSDYLQPVIPGLNVNTPPPAASHAAC